MKQPARAVSLAVVILGMLATALAAQVFLPGTRRSEIRTKLTEVARCAVCHAKTRSGSDAPLPSWQSGLMSQAMRDPVFRAAPAIANQDIEGIGDFCLRCHTPGGFLEGRADPPDASALNADDLHGVSCEVCHRMLDPRSAAAARTTKHVPPGYGNAMLVLDPTFTVHGPYADPSGSMPHRAVRSTFLARGQFCGSCHDVSNPLFADDPKKQAPHAYGHIERTFSEWSLSEFARQGPAGSCQSCHYKRLSGGGYPTRFGKVKRDYFPRHGAVGGSTWVQDAIVRLWGDNDVNREALELGKQRTRELLRSAASLELTFPAHGLARLRITNLAGHKLPTGYPEGRRMWVNMHSSTPRESYSRKAAGTARKKTRSSASRCPRRPYLIRKIAGYTSVSPPSARPAKEVGKKPGPSFHFVLNDVTVLDNRIPPKGFTNSAFVSRQCQPVGATYADGQHWDDIDFTLPAGTTRVAVRLMYQSVSWEYLKFLAETNKTDDWGKRLYDAWSKTGRCPPEVIAELTCDVSK